MRGLVKGEPAPGVGVLDVDGREIPLSSFWHERPAILAFLRHFG